MATPRLPACLGMAQADTRPMLERERATDVILDDTTLVAFVDGELDPVEASAVEAALRRDPAAAARAQALRESASLLRSAFGEMVAAPVPERLLAVVGRSPPPRVASGMRHSGRAPSGGYRAWMRIAATLALLVIGASGGWAGAEFWGRSGARQDGGMAADPVMLAVRGELVQATLESTKSGASNTWRDPRGRATLVVAPVRTFRDEEERFCREFRETATRDGVQTLLRHGVACRNPQGFWNTRFYVVPGADPPPALISG